MYVYLQTNSKNYAMNFKQALRKVLWAAQIYILRQVLDKFLSSFKLILKVNS